MAPFLSLLPGRVDTQRETARVRIRGSCHRGGIALRPAPLREQKPFHQGDVRPHPAAVPFRPEVRLFRLRWPSSGTRVHRPWPGRSWRAKRRRTRRMDWVDPVACCHRLRPALPSRNPVVRGIDPSAGISAQRVDSASAIRHVDGSVPCASVRFRDEFTIPHTDHVPASDGHLTSVVASTVAKPRAESRQDSARRIVGVYA